MLKVLEWNGMSLVDRSFEEVCAIMDRTGDTVELLVEHAADFRMCDLLDDPAPLNPGSSSGSGGGSNLRKATDDASSGLAPGNQLKICSNSICYKAQFVAVNKMQLTFNHTRKQQLVNLCAIKTNNIELKKYIHWELCSGLIHTHTHVHARTRQNVLRSGR